MTYNVLMEIIAWLAIVYFVIKFSLHCGIWFGEKLDKDKRNWALCTTSLFASTDIFYLFPTIGIYYYNPGVEVTFYWLKLTFYIDYTIKKE